MFNYNFPPSTVVREWNHKLVLKRTMHSWPRSTRTNPRLRNSSYRIPVSRNLLYVQRALTHLSWYQRSWRLHVIISEPNVRFTAQRTRSWNIQRSRVWPHPGLVCSSGSVLRSENASMCKAGNVLSQALLLVRTPRKKLSRSRLEGSILVRTRTIHSLYSLGVSYYIRDIRNSWCSSSANILAIPWMPLPRYSDVGAHAWCPSSIPLFTALRPGQIAFRTEWILVRFHQGAFLLRFHPISSYTLHRHWPTRRRFAVSCRAHGSAQTHATGSAATAFLCLCRQFSFSELYIATGYSTGYPIQCFPVSLSSMNSLSPSGAKLSLSHCSSCFSQSWSKTIECSSPMCASRYGAHSQGCAKEIRWRTFLPFRSMLAYSGVVVIYS